MSDNIIISPEVQRFIEAMGGYFSQYGMSRVAGRLMGLTMVVAHPLTLDEMAEALGVSRASISTNIRVIESTGFVEPVTVPRDRRDYYQYSGNSWEARLRISMVQLDTLSSIAKRGLDAIKEEDTQARTYLQDFLDFCEFLIEDERNVIQRWREYRKQHQSTTEEQHNYD